MWLSTWFPIITPVFQDFTPALNIAIKFLKKPPLSDIDSDTGNIVQIILIVKVLVDPILVRLHFQESILHLTQVVVESLAMGTNPGKTSIDCS